LVHLLSTHGSLPVHCCFSAFAQNSTRHPTRLTWLFPKEAKNGGSGFHPKLGPPIKKIEENVVASATITATTAEIFAAQRESFETTYTGAPSLSTESSTTAYLADAAHETSAAASAVAPTDRWRDWLWGFLAVLFLSQFYFVWQLVAVLSFFVLAFGAIAAVLFSGYLLLHSGEWALARFTAMRQPVLAVSPVSHNPHKSA